MTEKSTPKKKFYRFRDPFDRDFTLRLKITILMGAWGFMAFYLWSIVLKAKIPDSPLGTICTIVAFLSPVLGWMYYDIIDAVVHRVFGQIFMPEGKRTARAHSEGEALVQGQKFEEAIEWFTETVTGDPTDWQAQQRIIDILTNHVFDVERAAEARNRLLKLEGVREGHWINTALRLGRDWEDLDRPDRAINTYKSLLWKYKEGYDADEVRRRLADLGAKHE
ncbi:tetratricopeptide repeat protein [Gemmatimonadota bacterium]